MRRVTRLLASFTLVVFSSTASVAGPPTLRTIRVDGDVTDWTPVLVNPVQVTRDGDGSRIACVDSMDLDCPVPSSGRDLRLFAWTYGSLHLFAYVERCFRPALRIGFASRFPG